MQRDGGFYTAALTEVLRPSNGLDWNIDSNDSVILRGFEKIRMDQHFQKGTCLCLRGIDGP